MSIDIFLYSHTHDPSLSRFISLPLSPSLSLSLRGATVHCVCRSEVRGKEAVAELARETGNPNVHLQVGKEGRGYFHWVTWWLGGTDALWVPQGGQATPTCSLTGALIV